MTLDILVTQQKLEIQNLQQELEQLKNTGSSDRNTAYTRQAQQRVELILENSNAILFRRLAADDPKKRKMVYVSPNISRFGYKAEQFLNGEVMFRDLVYPKDSPRTLKEIQEFTKQGLEEYTQFYRIVTRQGEVRWVEDRTSVFEDEESGLRFHQGIVIDIHDRRVIEEKLKKSEEKHRRVIETTAEGFLFIDDNCLLADLNPAYERMTGLSRTELLGRRPVEITPDLEPHLNQLKENGGQQEIEGELTTSQGVKLPVLIHIGALISDSNQSLGAAAFITDISSHKQALRLAAEVQQGLLPLKPPSIPGLDIAGMSIPCDEVGGDFYDYLSDVNAGHNVAVVLGDVSGHGVDAALLMSSARSYLKACFAQTSSSEEIITLLNRHLVEDMGDSGRFMTLFYLFIDKSSNSLEWIRAGHDPAILYDPSSDSFTELKGPGVALGIEPTLTYQPQRLDNLSPGQIITLVTDGVWEAVNETGEMFGKERLHDLIREFQSHESNRILQQVIRAHSEFTAGTIIADDLTIVIIKT